MYSFASFPINILQCDCYHVVFVVLGCHVGEELNVFVLQADIVDMANRHL